MPVTAVGAEVLAEVDVERYRPLIAAALEYSGGTHTVQDIVEAVHAHRLQCWPGAHSVIISQIEDYPLKRVLRVYLAAGNLTELEAMLPSVEQFARAVGCSNVVFEGRKGWARTFVAQRGYEARLVSFDLSLSGSARGEEGTTTGHE